MSDTRDDSADREDDAESAGLTNERRKGVVMCERCRTVYAVWIHPDRGHYPISSYNDCSCDDGDRTVVDEV